MIPPFLRWPLLPLLLACVSSPSHALQLIDARDGVTVEAVISIKEATRIRIEHGPITDVFGNIHSSNCATAAPASTGAAAIPAMAAAPAVNPAGEIMLECDRDKGEVYVRPVGSSTKPVNLFVSSAGATYTLLLRRSDTPSDTIVIRDRNARTGSAMPHQGPLGNSANHVRAMKALLVAMASERSATDVRMEEVNRPVQLWNEVNFTLVRLFEARGLVGEKYLLTNISGQTMVLAEQEFDRADGSVLGVSIDHLNLRSGDSTSVYVIRQGK